jgi:hypothetical protein
LPFWRLFAALPFLFFSVAVNIFLMIGDKNEGVRSKTIFIKNPPLFGFITVYVFF